MKGIIIQARLGSTRLPNKMIRPFYNEKGIFELLVVKIKFAFPDLKIVVATTTNPIDDKIFNLCKQIGVDCFRGSESNVLQRFIKAAEKYNINKIVRVCADNPFLNMLALRQLIVHIDTSTADYISYKNSDNKPTILTHYGFWAEMVTLKALKKAFTSTTNTLYLEHVTNFIYSNPDEFNIDLIPISSKIEVYNNVRMTLDTQEDFDLLQEIYMNTAEFNGKPEDLVEKVTKNKIWLIKMEEQIIKNEK